MQRQFSKIPRERGVLQFQTSYANACVMGLSKHRQNDISIITRADHKGRGNSTYESTREREREEEREMERHIETSATEITDLPDDNPPWWRPRAHMGRTP